MPSGVRGPILCILLLGLALIILPIPFERLHDDEVIYWEITRNVARGLGFTTVTFQGPAIGRLPLPFLLGAPLMSLSEHIFVLRLLSGLLTIASALLIYSIANTLYGKKPALASSLLFLFSFSTLRFGTRFYTDIYGLFFFLIALCFLLRGRGTLGGFSYALAVLGREYWLGLYPFLILYLWRRKGPVGRFVLFSALPFAPFILYIALGPGLGYFLKVVSVLAVPRYYLQLSSGEIGELFRQLFQSWTEFLAVQLVTVVGFLAALRWGKGDRLLYLVLPQFLILSSIYGFVTNGAFTQYTIALQASMALVAGQGLFIIWRRLGREERFLPALAVLLITQALTFNYAATSLSLTGARGIYDLGYTYDREIISLLEERAQGETIVGVHGAFVKGAKGWEWAERNVSKAIAYNPDWYVTYPYLLRFKEAGGVEAYYIGPYVVIHTPQGRRLGDIIEPAEFKKWKLRS